MKLKSIFVTGTLLALASTSAHALTTIRISASNGDRGATQTAISKILTAGWTFRGTGGNATSANLSVAVGSNFGAWRGYFGPAVPANEVVIKVSYSGALAGLAAAASNPPTPQRYVFSDGTGTGAVLDPTIPAATLGTDYELAAADFGFSTNFQSTSPFKGLYQGVTYGSLVQENVGVSALGFYASPGFPTAHANITTQQAQLLYTNGSLPLSSFTGNSADVNKIVYAIGRNTDAGQRYGAYTEIGLGTSTLVKVWSQTDSLNATTVTGQNTSFSGIPFGGTVTSHRPWPAETWSGISSPEGSGGFPSGQSLAPTLTRVLGVDAYKGVVNGEPSFPDATAGYYIGYVTPNDALTRILGVGTAAQTPLADGAGNTASRGVALSYNGVPLHNAVNGSGATVNTANIQNGKYTAWLYNRIVKSTAFNSLPNSDIRKAFSNALRDQIRTTDATVGGGLKIGSGSGFNVERLTDGGLVTPL